MSKQKHLPNGMPIDAVSRAYTKELERHSEKLIEEISSFLAQRIPDGVSEATVEVFPDEYGDGVASVGLYLSGKLTKHIPFAEYVNDLPLIDVQSYEDEFRVPDLIVDHVKRWFAESWWKACGWQYSLPVELFGHEGFGDCSSIKLTNKC